MLTQAKLLDLRACASVLLLATSASMPLNAAPLALPACEAKSAHLFNVEDFASTLESYRANAPELRAIATAALRPETFLAAIEYFSARQNYSGFHFDEWVAKLGPKELKKLAKHLRKGAPHGRLSARDFRVLLKKVYRLLHKPDSFWWALIKNRSIAKARTQIERQELQEELELSLFERGMRESFEAIIDEPSLRARFMEFVDRSNEARGIVGAAASWLLALSAPLLEPQMQPPMNWYSWVIYLPPYIPAFAIFAKPRIDDADRQELLDHDLDDGLATVEASRAAALKSYRRYGWARRIYAAGIMTAIGLTFGVTALENIQIESQRAGEARWQRTQETMQTLDRLAAMTPEQQGEEDFNEYVKFMRKRGLQVDLNSPEMINEKATRIRIYKEIAEEQARALKTKTGEASAAPTRSP